MKAECVSIRNLLVKRGGRVALVVDELRVQKGEVLAIIGPNGAGKSTLLLTLARLLKPERGEILLNGQPISEIPDLIYRRRIALVLQDPLLFDTSVYENVAIGLRFRNLPKSEIHPKVESWLRRFEIAHLAERRAAELSGGEGQRVSLARAMVLEPELLLLDEPFAALDPPTRSRLLNDLGRILSESHTTTIFITHNLDEAYRLAHRIAVVMDGRLQAIGVPQEVIPAFPGLIPSSNDFRY
ncbi:MAG: ATP-binding cassette domain-containing protein [Anaerolineales bacterium]